MNIPQQEILGVLLGGLLGYGLILIFNPPAYAMIIIIVAQFMAAYSLAKDYDKRRK